MQSTAPVTHVCPAYACRATLRQDGQDWVCPACGGRFRRPCPACDGWLRLASHGSGGQDWLCTDSTCPTIVTADRARCLAVRDDVLGAPVEALMRAPVTPQGGGGGNGRTRRAPKPGDREAVQARRERRYLDQGAAGGRESERGCDRLTSQVITVRLSRRDAERVRVLAEQHGSIADVLRESLDIMEALCGGRVDGDQPDVV